MVRFIITRNAFYSVLILVVTTQDVVLGWKRNELRRKIGELLAGAESKDNKPGPIVEGCNLCVWEKCNPAITPIPNVEFHPSADADIIDRAMFHVFNVQSEPLTSILTSRSETQRNEISEHFKSKTGHSLTLIIQDNFFGTRYGYLMTALATPLAEFYAVELKTTIKNLMLSHETENNRIALVEMFTTLSPCLITNIIKSYNSQRGQGAFVTDIEAAFKGKVSQFTDTVDLVKTLANANRNDDTSTSWFTAWKDARRMKEAIEKDNWNEKKFVFKEIFTQRSIPQLKETIRLYEEHREKDKNFESLDVDIKNNLGSVKEIYLIMVKIVKNQSLYFASTIEKMFVDYNTVNHFKFISLIRRRCDIDLDDIKRAYKKRYEKELVETFSDREKSRKQYYNAVSAILV